MMQVSGTNRAGGLPHNLLATTQYTVYYPLTTTQYHPHPAPGPSNIFFYSLHHQYGASIQDGIAENYSIPILSDIAMSSQWFPVLTFGPK